MFSKPLNQVTCDDVRSFLAKGVKEGKNIDYKLNFPSNKDKIPKTIAAFANTTGGVIIFGVDEEDDKPKPPFNGLEIPPEKKLETQLAHYALDVVPVPYVETHVCPPDASNHTFGIIQVPQSALAPHHLTNDKGIYIRTGESGRAEDIIHPDKIPWLFEYRRKSGDLRRELIEQARQRFQSCYSELDTVNMSIRTGFVLPLYPDEPIFSYENAESILGKIAFNDDYRVFKKRSIPGGVMFCRTPDAHLDFVEMVDAGLLYWCGNIRRAPDGRVNPYFLAKNICDLLMSSVSLYAETGFWGPLLIQYTLSGVRGLKVHPFTEAYQDNDTLFSKIVDDQIRIAFSIPASAIEDSILSLAMKCTKQLLWGLGLPEVTLKDMAETLKSKECLPVRLRSEKDIVEKLIEAASAEIPEANFSLAV